MFLIPNAGDRFIDKYVDTKYLERSYDLVEEWLKSVIPGLLM